MRLARAALRAVVRAAAGQQAADGTAAGERGQRGRGPARSEEAAPAGLTHPAGSASSAGCRPPVSAHLVNAAVLPIQSTRGSQLLHAGLGAWQVPLDRVVAWSVGGGDDLPHPEESTEVRILT
jgi:hypothetical protein